MTGVEFVQLISSCVGIVGSLFFAIGIMRQSTQTMANVASTYYDWNSHMISALAAQKADYIFGGTIIVLAFTMQLISFLVPTGIMLISPENAAKVPWLAVVVTVAVFVLLRLSAKKLAAHFETQIKNRLERQHG